jgi:hypothetical protein
VIVVLRVFSQRARIGAGEEVEVLLPFSLLFRVCRV